MIRESIQKAIDHVENNIKEDLTAEELAGIAGYSVFHFYRFFHSAVGVPVMQYVLRRKLFHAINEIGEGRKKNDVVYEYGFETYSGFYRSFIREIGYTPNLGNAKKAIEISKALENVGQSSPIIVQTNDGREYVEYGELYFVLTKKVNGQRVMASKLYLDDYEAKPRFIGELVGQLDLALAKIDVLVDEANTAKAIKEWAVPSLKGKLEVEADFMDDFAENFYKLYQKLPRQIIHRDPNPSNIILADDKWGVIDFELSERNASIRDFK